MEKLFSYGTLQQENVQIETFGRKLTGQKDTLIGYILSEVVIKDPAVIDVSGKAVHPILKYTGKPTDTVAGSVFELTPEELAQADDYEVDEYTRVKEEFRSGIQAWAYVCAVTEVSRTATA